MDGSQAAAAPDFLSILVSVIKIVLVVGVPLGLFIWWRNTDTRLRQQEKQAQERFNLILTREVHRQNKQL